MAVVNRQPRVRPSLRRFAIAAFVILVPIALHTAWDHYEARRLARIVADIRARNEPISSIRATSVVVDSPENAARYYEAAAALVDSGNLYEASGLLRRLRFPTPADRPLLLQDIRLWLDRNREAESLLARATDLPFAGYAPGTSYSYRHDRLFKLATLANFRALERLDQRDAEGAARSVVQQIKSLRPMAMSGTTDLSVIGFGTAGVPALQQAVSVLEQDPSDAMLRALQSAIREQDKDAAIEQALLAERAFHLGSVWNESHRWYARQRDVSDVLWYPMRPFMIRQFTRRIEIMTALLGQARLPWPARLHIDVPSKPSNTTRDRRFPFLGQAQVEYQLRANHRSLAASVATALALGRTTDAAIAIERYRRAHAGSVPGSLAQLVPEYLPAVPLDPFSGREIHYSKSAHRYAVYSVGTNERDDGGTRVELPARRGAVQTPDAPLDLGVAIALSSRSDR